MEAKDVKQEMGKLADLLSPLTRSLSTRLETFLSYVVQPFALLCALHVLSYVEETSERKESF